MTSLALEAHFFSSLMFFQFSILSTCLSLFCLIYIQINWLGSRMQIPLFRNVALSMMVVHVFASIAHGARISISITLGYTFVNICTSIDGCTPASMTSSFCIACASTNCCSIAFFSSDSSMFTRSTNVALGLACALEIQPLICLYKNSIVDVPDLYIS